MSDRSPLEREMGPRSVIASLLLGMQPPRLSGARLVEFCGLFGITENAARVAMSRMVERGELIPRDGLYELAGGLRPIQDEQQRVLTPPVAEWDGFWRLAIVREVTRPAAARAALRTAARRARLAELRPGVWGRPDNLGGRAVDEAWAVVGRDAGLWRAVPDVEESAAALDRFGLRPWAARARELLEAVEQRTAALGAGAEAIPPAFLAGAAALQHLRRDPLLPDALLPADWPGEALRAGYRTFQPHFALAAAAFFREARGPERSADQAISDP